jgi:hypothetical protein
MVVLRDGEWSVWCRCGWRSPPSPALSQLAVRHPCGSGGTPATRGRRAAVPLQGGCLSDSHGDMFESSGPTLYSRPHEGSDDLAASTRARCQPS